MARGHMARESGLQTLTATALVHEAWLRVSKDEGQQWESRRHFFGAAAQAMRRILINRARDKTRLKRGGEGAERVPLDAVTEAEAAILTLPSLPTCSRLALRRLARSSTRRMLRLRRAVTP